jgi:hypothetical protein
VCVTVGLPVFLCLESFLFCFGCFIIEFFLENRSHCCSEAALCAVDDIERVKLIANLKKQRTFSSVAWMRVTRTSGGAVLVRHKAVQRRYLQQAEV